MIRHLLERIVLLSALVGSFISCSDEKTVTNVTQESYAPIEIYESESKLPECGTSNANQQVFVKGDSSLRVCSDAEWQKISVTDFYTNVSCNTVPLRNNSGYKVVCNGDSVGVVQNGSAGAKGEDGTGCSLSYDKEAEISVIVCGKDSVVVDFPIADLTGPKETPEDTSGNTHESPVDTAEVIPEIEEKNDSAMAISMDSLAGYSQKGPFAKGSMVYLYELQDGRTLKQTNGSFVSRIDSDDGHFKFVARNLVSQYVLMQATGYYLNEVTNRRTTEMLTLNAITDVSERSSANINVLTHLEYPRVYHLVTKEKLRFYAAKSQARAEVLRAFGYDTTDVGNFEDMLVLDASNAVNAMLYDISVMLQGNLTVAQLTERLNDIAKDLETDGKWDNAKLRAEIADWLLDSTSVYSYDAWKFWVAEYGLQECTGSDSREFYVAKNSYGKYNGRKFYCSGSYGPPTRATTSDTLIGRACFNEIAGEKATYTGKYWIRDFVCSYHEYDARVKWRLTASHPSSSLSTMTDPRDNKTYAVVTIGDQTWMAENLNYADTVAYPSLVKAHRCFQKTYEVIDSSDCRLYGQLYKWAAVVDSVNTGCSEYMECSLVHPVQGICPDGWHIPDTSEVRELIDFVASENPGKNIADVLRSEIDWDDAHGTNTLEYNFETNGLDLYGFGLLKYGLQFWTTTFATEAGIVIPYPSKNYTFDALRPIAFGSFERNVRCIKDQE